MNRYRNLVIFTTVATTAELQVIQLAKVGQKPTSDNSCKQYIDHRHISATVTNTNYNVSRIKYHKESTFLYIMTSIISLTVKNPLNGTKNSMH